jgi:hypothetical protein
LQRRAVGDPAKIEDVCDHRDLSLTVSLTFDDRVRRFGAQRPECQQNRSCGGAMLK